MVITLVKYLLIFGGLCAIVLGFVKDIDLLTFTGLFLVLAPLMVGGSVIKLISRNKKINPN
jgi:hypothetical protein